MDIKKVLSKHGLTVESEFVPFSQSRNSKEKTPSLNWKVTLKRRDTKILTTDYMAGCAHAPSYQQRETYDSRRMVIAECENGFACRMMYSLDFISFDKKKPILPNPQDVVYSLLIDSEVLDYSSFEDWAESFGYEPDSRSAEKTYNDCMKIALQFRQLGESVIAELKEAYQDY